MSRLYMTSDFQQLLQKLYNLQRLGIKTGLEHTCELLEVCDNPQKKIKFIHLAGTNGKGSTAAFISSILRSIGLKVGLYTSPHLVSFNERIRVDGIPITNNKIVEFMELFSADIQRIENTFFETTSAIAFWHFAREEVDIAVVETGLGGRLDSTNVITPEIAVITPISLDHRELLGNDLVTIAKEKAGIIKENVPVICNHQENMVKNVLLEKAAEMNTKISFVKPPTDCTVTMEGTFFHYKDTNYQLTLIGEHQALNAALAVAAVQELEKGIFDIKIKRGLQNTTWPGRFQVLSKTPPVIYDVAHNEQGIRSVLKTFNQLFKQKPLGLIVLKEDKELELIATALRGQFETLFVMDDTNGLLMKSKTLAAHLNKLGISAEPVKNLRDFTDHLQSDYAGLVFGSHYIAEAVFEYFQFSFDTAVI
ncbi:MAG TPA: folylpolyglutamate synthase/dihydrofolate synthase family protein [Candidatus Marinimicrobia bacterium]|nr:bifunctional folylpolyglutamate synthase/dihydrofolate synthase [Candidatus Neomarinimicrobiota bacterium]MDP6275763.1 folylpolyglutamate synthase/dihydrofolate synthase family protein [Candidatus Neomarinimicrobiota bacterium]MDP7331370.1 folylpolyglutamate synthase/dihydrofolate synthase family protein [Candidatus Neomarinimicrobiota bacterium]HJL75550.1 folylpolyglutamate synthase/dihydrofolate synthase family protein [Candidatus Neomarinimicrobiota bacterium]HJM70431.1 folylpolyglutamate